MPMMTLAKRMALFMQITEVSSTVAHEQLDKHGGNLCKALKGFLEEGSIDIPSEEELDLAINTPQDDSPGASNQNPLSQSSASPVSPRRKSLGQRMKEAYKAWKKKNAGASSSQQKDVPKGANDPDLLNEDPAITERKAKEREAYHERICRDYRNIERVIRISVILPDKLRIARIFSKREKLEEVFEFVNIVGLGESLSTAYRLVSASFPIHLISGLNLHDNMA
ncbi:hypothetical protein GmHk_15G044816 [Glycine max]|nr:hypothetical protein GmHk_15G044816 [Glycine max]